MNAKVNILPEFRNDSRGNLASAYESGLAKVFNYNGVNVTFKTEDGMVYINATEMAKAFDKRPIDYLRLQSTNELISSVVRFTHIGDNQLVIRIKGGSEGGGSTWMHEDIALDFAQWLSIDFKVWCNIHIKELLITGKTELAKIPESVKVDKAETLMKCAIMTATFLLDKLGGSKASVAALVNKAARAIGSPEIEYVPSNGVKFSATDLLKKLGRMETIHQFNAKMEERGLLETKERTSRSSKTGKKKFKALTETGLEYGDNEVSPNNPNETQPRYFEHKFKELLDLIFG